MSALFFLTKMLTVYLYIRLTREQLILWGFKIYLFLTWFSCQVEIYLFLTKVRFWSIRTTSKARLGCFNFGTVANYVWEMIFIRKSINHLIVTLILSYSLQRQDMLSLKLYSISIIVLWVLACVVSPPPLPHPPHTNLYCLKL